MISSLSSQKTGFSEALRILNAVPGFSNRRILKLIAHYGNALKVLSADPAEVSAIAGVPLAAALNLVHFNASRFLEEEARALAQSGARAVTYLDADYPPRLKEIADVPLVLYMRGGWPAEDIPLVAIVGARRASLYGIETAERLAFELAGRGCCVVSGMAAGIDAAAHRGALKSGGATIGVLGTGLDVRFPQSNQELYGMMERQGCLVSEFPFGMQPSKYTFPRRNRIVSGLALGVVVVEAGIKSGALITAAFALEQGREVFAVPGRMDMAQSLGPLSLIRQGAKMVMGVEDILEELQVRCAEEISEEPEFPAGLDEQELALFKTIKEGEVTFEQLEQRLAIPPALLMRPLLTLQIRRLIRECPGKVYVAQKYGGREKQ